MRIFPAMSAATVAIAAVAAFAPAARGASVTVRVESSTDPAPLFAGTVSTLPHAVDGGDGSGPHKCDGPPSAPPSATATGALDDAMRAAGIPWRGNWDPSFHDFFIERIGADASEPPDRYWSLTVNGRFSSGGCLARVADGDTVRFFYGPLFGAEPTPEAAPDAPQPGPTGEKPPIRGQSGISARRLRRIGAAAERFLRRSEGPGQKWATLALAFRDGRGEARAAADLLGGRLAEQGRDGSIDGDVNATAVAAIALRLRDPHRAARAAAWLAGAQSARGGFGFREGVEPDIDTTGLAAWALALDGLDAAARRAGLFIAHALNPDGGFPSMPGGSSNSQSTGLALVGLRVSGIGPRGAIQGQGLTPLDYLASLACHNGSIAYDDRAGSSPTPVWSTAQALLGLTGRETLLGLDRVSASSTTPLLQYASGTRLHGGKDLD